MRSWRGALTGLGSALALSCTPAPEPVGVTLIGLDGATWRVIDPLLARGELPNLQRLIASGARGPLRSELPLVSPPLWTTIATGVSRKVHGLLDFDLHGVLVSSRDRRVPALWTVAHASGLRSAVIGWWGTFPAESIDGVMISERALKTREADLDALFSGGLQPAAVEHLAHPPEAMAALADAMKTPLQPLPGQPEGQRVRRNMRREDAACVRALLASRRERGPFDLEMVLLRGIDPVSHFFWRFHEPDAAAYGPALRPSAAQVARLGDTVRAHYRYVDGLLGELLADAPGRVVLLVSDHGFEAGRQPFRDGRVLSGTHESVAARDGIFVASGGPIRPGARPEDLTIYDVAPLVHYLLGTPQARSLVGRLPLELFEVQWATRRPVTVVDHYAMAPTNLPPDAALEVVSLADGEMAQELRALGYVQ